MSLRELAAGGQGNGVIGTEGPLSPVQGALEQGNDIGELRGIQAGHGQVVAGVQGDGVAGAQDPLGVGQAGTRVGTSQVDSFTVGAGGRLTAARVTVPRPGPVRQRVPPHQPRQPFVSNAHNTDAGSGTVSAFRDTADGTLTSIGSSHFADNQTAPCWVEITHNGRFLFTVNTASGTVSSYSIAPGGALHLLGSTPIRGTSGLAAWPSAGAWLPGPLGGPRSRAPDRICELR